MAEVYRQRNIGHCFLPLARNNLSCYTERINGIIEPLNLQCCNVGSVSVFSITIHRSDALNYSILTIS